MEVTVHNVTIEFNQNEVNTIFEALYNVEFNKVSDQIQHEELIKGFKNIQNIL